MGNFRCQTLKAVFTTLSDAASGVNVRGVSSRASPATDAEAARRLATTSSLGRVATCNRYGIMRAGDHVHVKPGGAADEPT